MNFFDAVYSVVKQVPRGKVISYGQVATLIGNKRASRQVGWALHVNPSPETIPCHRVVYKDGKLCKSFAFGGEARQMQLLIEEGVKFNEKGFVKPCFFVDIGV